MCVCVCMYVCLCVCVSVCVGCMFCTSFAKVNIHPNQSLDADGFDAWSSQGIIKPQTVCDPHCRVSPPDWLRHSELKSPWLYVERSTPNSHLAYSDVGDLRFVHTNGSCPVSSNHPAIILNRPCAKVHVKLEDLTNTVHPRVLWDQVFQLRNSAPGGLGTKIVDYQKPLNESPNLEFIPFCFKGVNDLDFYETKFRLTTESLADPADAGVAAFKDVAILRPRPLCDIPIHTPMALAGFL